MDPSMKNWILSLLYLDCTIKNRVFRFRLIKREVVNTLVKKSKVNLKHSICVYCHLSSRWAIGFYSTCWVRMWTV